MPVENPIPAPEENTHTFTLEEVTQLTQELKQMPDDQRDALYYKVGNLLPTTQDRPLIIEMRLLQEKTMMLYENELYQLGQSDEEIEAHIAQRRKRLQETPPITVEEADQLAQELKQMSPDQREALRERVENLRLLTQDPALTLELRVLGKRIKIADANEEYQLGRSDKGIEAEIAAYRKDLQEDPFGEEPIPYNSSVFPDGPPTVEEEERLERERIKTEQAKFFSFLTERIQTGIIPFDQTGKPARKAMDDAVMLYFRPEEAIRRGIPETPPLDAPLQPVTEEQTAYLTRLQERMILAAGHTTNRLPWEPSMHKIIRELNKEQKPKELSARPPV